MNAAGYAGLYGIDRRGLTEYRMASRAHGLSYDRRLAPRSVPRDQEVILLLSAAKWACRMRQCAPGSDPSECSAVARALHRFGGLAGIGRPTRALLPRVTAFAAGVLRRLLGDKCQAAFGAFG